MNRRDFLKLGLASSLLGSCDAWKKGGRLGLALGGGGARGLAHILMLEVLDDLGISPHRIAGTSIGAVFGSMYAAGMSGHDIRQLVTGVSRFDQLSIPLKIVAADFWEREAVVFESGSLGPAIQASIAIPGLFSPVQHRGRVLVDGGLVNPVPYDLLFDDCDVVVAIDVSGNRNPKTDNGPGYFETVFNTMQITQAAILREKMKLRQPHIYIRPGLEDIRVLDFNRVDEIYQQSRTAADKLRRELRQRYPD
jgi:NTE family protein